MLSRINFPRLSTVSKIRKYALLRFPRLKSYLKSDVVEISGKKIIPPENPKALEYFNNRNIPVETLVRGESAKEAYSLIQRYRNGDEEAIKTVNSIKEVVDNSPHSNHDFDFKDEALNHLAFIYRLSCRSHFNEPLKYSPLESPRLFRAIGESEYKALMEGKHIVSKLCNDEEVMVTNSPKGVACCTSGKLYFVHFKDRINFDPLASSFFNLNEAKVPNVYSHNRENAEYYIRGGYNIEDVEKIIDPKTKRVVYSRTN